MGKRFQYSGPQTPGKNTAAQFIAKISAAAIKACANTGILPSVVIGIALKESGNGNDYKAAVFNNLFGHMALSSWDGDGVRKGTGNAPYWRVYNSIEEAIAAHVAILRQGKYKVAGVALKKTPVAQLQALQKAGYNVGPDKHVYVSKISGIINKYGLDGYDERMFALEREMNDNNLAFHEQDGITKALHNILS